MIRCPRFTKRSVEITHTSETRNEADSLCPRIVGYGAVFFNANDPGTEYRLHDDVVEHIMPGAFDRAIREDDVRSMFNHDSNFVLGRNQAGTLKLSVDETGLFYEVEPPISRSDVLESIERGDVDGSSFMFVPSATTWREVTRDDKTLFVREINEVQLFEVGPVVFPAYESSTAQTRDDYVREVMKDRDRWLHKTRNHAEPEPRFSERAVRVRKRILEIESHGFA